MDDDGVIVEQHPARCRLAFSGERPLLVLQRVGEGRVAQLLSDQAWLWARGVDQGGPQVQLLRPLGQQVVELERRAIAAALQATDGNKLAAARLLGISRATLYGRLHEPTEDPRKP